MATINAVLAGPSSGRSMREVEEVLQSVLSDEPIVIVDVGFGWQRASEAIKAMGVESTFYAVAALDDPGQTTLSTLTVFDLEGVPPGSAQGISVLNHIAGLLDSHPKKGTVYFSEMWMFGDAIDALREGFFNTEWTIYLNLHSFKDLCDVGLNTSEIDGYLLHPYPRHFDPTIFQRYIKADERLIQAMHNIKVRVDQGYIDILRVQPGGAFKTVRHSRSPEIDRIINWQNS